MLTSGQGPGNVLDGVAQSVQVMACATTLLSKPPLGLTLLAAPTPDLGSRLRHRDDTEVQPVPGVPEECEVVNAEASGQHLNKRFESVDPSEGVPGKKRAGQGHGCHLDITTVYVCACVCMCVCVCVCMAAHTQP